jgi:hypothetical protein
MTAAGGTGAAASMLPRARASRLSRRRWRTCSSPPTRPTLAGSQLPAGAAEAIEGERQAFAALWNGWAGDQPPGEHLLAAASRCEADWTPELRAALAAVIEATGTGEQ